MSFEVITYATHSERMFPQLMESGYPIKVLGWGEKWENFMTKIKGVLEYVKTKEPDDIIVCVDAFDTMINRDPREAEQLFKDMNCGFLVSENSSRGYLTNMKFGVCRNDITANMGLWMGYVKDIITIFEDMLKTKCATDDQSTFNSLCGKYGDIIKIDMEKKIFYNSPDTNYTSSKSIFTGYPLSLDIYTFAIRMLKENLRFIMVPIALLCAVLYTLFPQTKIYLLFLYLVLLTIYMFIGEKICINIT